MKVRLKTLMAGPEGVFQPGSVVDLDAEQAEALVSSGYAERLERPVETAAIEPSELEMRPAPRPRKAR
jgi:hypothetical protein